MLNKMDKNDVALRSASQASIEFQQPSKDLRSPSGCSKNRHTDRINTDVCPDMHLTNPEVERGTRPEETFKKLLEMNEKYLIEKGKA
jgi:hypothetical protein